jgi:hypothetical protein
MRKKLKQVEKFEFSLTLLGKVTRDFVVNLTSIYRPNRIIGKLSYEAIFWR